VTSTMRTVLILLGLLLAQPVWAEWVGIVSSNYVRHYHDPSTVRKTATGKITIWELTDYPETQETLGGVKLSKPFWSYKWLQEYDCNKEAVRPLRSVHYAGPMGYGAEVSSNNTPSRFGFTAVSPGTIGYKMLQAACAIPLN
jgi:hypothetical protein